MNKDDLFSSRGRLFLQVIQQPGITPGGLAKKLFLSRRSIWGMVGELRRMNYLVTRKDGRHNHYYASAYGLEELRSVMERQHESPS